MSDKPLFQNLDEQERIYAPDQVPENERVIADETSGIVRQSIDEGDITPAPVPISTGGSAAATPPSESFDPGMEREEADMRTGDSGIVGPDVRDEQAKPFGSLTQERETREGDL
jgi:hypothetical protein